jgi:4-aminobutyrate aminotransferase-like enzyme
MSKEEYGHHCVQQFARLFESEYNGVWDPKAGQAEYAAFYVEPIQGTGGYVIPPRNFFVELKRVLDKYGILLVVDEIQTGMGRSGRLWACEHEDVVPDLLATSKGLASGMPISAVLGDAEILSSWGPGAHVATFAATPLAAAAALATLDVLERERLVVRAEEMGAYFRQRLEELQESHPILGWIDQRGLFVGLEFVRDRATKEPLVGAGRRICRRARELGLITRPLGDVVTLVPPLATSEDDLAEMTAILGRAIDDAAR